MSSSRDQILVVEDSDEDFDTLREVAEEVAKPWLLRRASTGDDCLRLLLEDVERESTLPTLVLLDLNVPGMDGRQALAAIRQKERLRHLPVVVLSTSKNPADVAYCYALGANAYHVKPVDYADHLTVLDRILTYWLTTVTLPRV